MMKTRLTAFVLTLILLCTLVACLGNENATVFTTDPPSTFVGPRTTGPTSPVTTTQEPTDDGILFPPYDEPEINGTLPATSTVQGGVTSDEYASGLTTTFQEWRQELVKEIRDTSPLTFLDEDGRTYKLYGKFYSDGSGFLGTWCTEPSADNTTSITLTSITWFTDDGCVCVDSGTFGRLTFSSFDTSPFRLIEVEKGSLPTPTPPPSPTPVHDSYYYYGYRMDSDGEYETIEVRISTYDKKASLYYNSMDAVIGSLHPIGSETVDYVYTQGRFTLQTRIGTLVLERISTSTLGLRLISGFEEVEPLWEVFTTAPEGVD